MTNPLKSLFFLSFSLLVGHVNAETAVATTDAPVAVASAFQVIDDARAENEDADLAFVQAAIARNEGAIEAAKAVLKTSFDADIRMLAGDSLKAHDTELRSLKAWLNLHGPKTAPAPVAALPAAPAKAEVSTPAEPLAKPAVKTAALPSATVPVVAPVQEQVTPTVMPPVPAGTEVTVTLPRDTSATHPPLPGANLSMQEPEQPAMLLLDVPPVPAALTPVTPQPPLPKGSL